MPTERMKRSEIKLKPCPFCGDKATIDDREKTSAFSEPYIEVCVQCTNCGASIKRIVYGIVSKKDLCETVIEAWNRRAKQ